MESDSLSTQELDELVLECLAPQKTGCSLGMENVALSQEVGSPSSHQKSNAPSNWWTEEEKQVLKANREYFEKMQEVIQKARDWTPLSFYLW